MRKLTNDSIIAEKANTRRKLKVTKFIQEM